MINEWPESQVCMDCLHANWLTEAKKAAVVHPACECSKMCFPQDAKCELFTNITDVKTVTLIASGYEWECPGCFKGNTEIEIAEKVTCNTCNREFKVDMADHAHE